MVDGAEKITGIIDSAEVVQFPNARRTSGDATGFDDGAQASAKTDGGGKNGAEAKKSRSSLSQGRSGSYDDEEYGVEHLNERFGFLIVGGAAVIVDEDAGRAAADRVRFLPVNTFKELTRNKFNYRADSSGNIKAVNAGADWLKSPHRREYDGLEFYPTTNGEHGTDGYFNLWRGFGVAPVAKKGGYAILADHLLTNICGGNKEHYDWIFGWFAAIFQAPRERRGTSIVFKGKMGTGKTTFCEAIGYLLGQHYLIVDKAEHIVGKFNAHLASCLLLQAEEAVWAGDKAGEGSLKSLVTSKENMIEFKGRDSIKVKNYVHVVMTTNEDWAIPAGPDERRFAVFDVGDLVKENHTYFKEMSEQLHNGGYEALLYDLLNFDLSSINLRQIPRTEALLKQKQRSFDGLEGFYYHILNRGHQFSDDWVWNNFVATELLHNEYVAYMDKLSPGKRREDSSVMITKLKAITDGLITSTPRKMTVTIKGTARRANGYEWPKLEVLREQFCQYVQQEVAFDDVSDN